MASWGRFLGAMSWLHFEGASASISRMNRHYFSHDQATIGPRSGHDRAAIGPRSGSGSFDDRLHFILEAIPPRSLSDRGSIAPRSRFDRTAIVEFFHDMSGSSDETSNMWTVRSRSTRCSPITGIANNPSRPMMLRSRPTRCSHRARSRPSDEDPPIKIAPRASP